MKISEVFWFLRSPLGIVNFFLFQFLFMRVQQEVTFWDDAPGGPQLVYRGYSLIGPVVPLTGWWSDYVPNKPNTLL